VDSPSLPTLWVDTTTLTARVDGTATMRFYTVLREASVEACRIHTSVDHLKRIVDMLARSLEYYPTQATIKTTSKKRANA